MSTISLLIVDDDINKITSIIKTIKEIFNETLLINQASCVQEAIDYLKKTEYHLLITDLQMPLRYADQPTASGGQSLIKNIYRKKTGINVPMYIVGLTQYEELMTMFKGSWKVWHYDSSLEDWKIDLRDLIHHISLVNSRISIEKIETIFVEGVTDKKILETAINKYFEAFVGKVNIETVMNGGGASWVERQLFIWAKSLTRKNNHDTYIKAIGIFDDDVAGQKSIQKIRNEIQLDSSESRTFHIKKNSYKYSPVLKSIKSKGILFPITLEEMIDVNCWKKAQVNGWLIERNPNSYIINEKIISIQAQSLEHKNLVKLGFTNDEILILTKKINPDYKMQFCNLACDHKSNSLCFIHYQLKDIFETLNFIP